VLVAWSKRSVGPQGEFVQDEATRAKQRRVYVPVTIDKVNVPLGFGESQALPLTGWKGDRSDSRYQAVIAAVQRLLGEARAVPAAQPVASRGVSRRVVIGGGAVGVAAVAGVGAFALLKPRSAAVADSIAVLPFANLSGDPAQGYFSDGVAEELRSALARLAGLKVVGRTSSEAVRNDDAATAAKKLGVANVLIGSVRSSPSTIRVSAQLVDGKDGVERWSQSYDRSPGDAIKIQTDIAEKVAQALKVALGSVGKAALTVGGTDNAQAQRLLLEADAVAGGSQGSFERALELIDAAITLDPNYAQAYALKAIFLLVMGDGYARGERELAQARAEALRYARKAVTIAPNLPVGHGALAEYHRSTLNISAAAAAYRRLMELQSGEPNALRSYAFFLSRMGYSSQALKLAEEAIALDPLNPLFYGTRASVLYSTRRYQEAAKSLANLKRDSPHLFDSPLLLGDALMMVGRTEDAARAYSERPADDPFRLTGEAILAIRTGDPASALAKKRILEQQFGETMSYQYGQIHAQLGQPNEALTHLERAWAIKDAGLLSMRVDPWLDPIRSQPRFGALMRAMRFPGA
jgi:serine/threonine-protein kinase